MKENIKLEEETLNACISHKHGRNSTHTKLPGLKRPFLNINEKFLSGTVQGIRTYARSQEKHYHFSTGHVIVRTSAREPIMLSRFPLSIPRWKEEGEEEE